MSVRHLLGATVLATSAAQADVLVFDDFEGYAGSPANTPAYGSSELNFSAFSELNVEDGTVDLIGADDPWNLMTGYGSGFVDLDGSTGNGGVLRTDVYAFDAGDLVTLSFEASGNQRGGTDDWSFGFTTGAATTFFDAMVLNAPGAGWTALGNPSGGSLSSGMSSLASNSPWTRYAISFRAANAGALSAFVGTSSNDNIGPLVDNVSLDITGRIGAAAVPEPATWAMMILGVGGIGAALRRRRARLGGLGSLTA